MTYYKVSISTKDIGRVVRFRTGGLGVIVGLEYSGPGDPVPVKVFTEDTKEALFFTTEGRCSEGSIHDYDIAELIDNTEKASEIKRGMYTTK